MTEQRDFLEGRCVIHVGDCLDVLRAMPGNSIDCVVTSPPYWGLRDYGVDGQIGLEPTLAEHLAVMVTVFEEVRRVLKPTGTCWVNYGDCYATSPNGRSAADTKAAGTDDRTFRDKPFSTVGPIYKPEYERTASTSKSANKGNVAGAHGGRVVAGGYLKPKDLCMVPNRFAIALQDAGWWVRSEIIWAKPNPMPESIKDRPATAHEKVFLFTKAQRYDYDAEAVRQTGAADTIDRYHRGRSEDHKWADGGPDGQSIAKSFAAMAAKNPKDKLRAADHASPRHAGHINHTSLDDTLRGHGRSLRNYEPAPVDVWPIATQPFSEAHFATFPPQLAERCVLAGCPKGGTVLDPFGGAGTTALVALRHGRRAELIELNPDYADIAERRIRRDWREWKPAPSKDVDLPLFSQEAAE